MHSYAFEVYILSLVLFAKYPLVATDMDSAKPADPGGQEQTTTSVPVVSGAEPTKDGVEIKGKISPLEHYKKLFSEHRAYQVKAVKSMQRFGNPEAQFQLVKVMLSQLFKNLHDARQNLTMWGFLPGDDFPTNETVRESMSKVLENTALFGDMVLRMPTAVHEFYDKNREWQLLLAWSYGFCNESAVFEGPHQMMLNLMGQEVNLIRRSPDYFNPFLADEDAQEKVPVSVMPKKTKEKKTKKLQRGPRMSRTEL